MGNPKESSEEFAGLLGKNKEVLIPDEGAMHKRRLHLDWRIPLDALIPQFKKGLVRKLPAPTDEENKERRN